MKSNDNLYNLRSLSVIVLTASLPLAWFVIGSIGFVQLKPYHVGIIFILCASWFSRSILISFLKATRECPSFKIFYIGISVYLAVLLLATVLNGEDINRGFRLIGKQYIYLIFSMLISSLFFHFLNLQKHSVFILSVLVSAIVFLIITYLTFLSMGASYFDFIYRFLSSPSISSRVEFMGVLFKYLKSTSTEDLQIQKSIVHNIANGIYFSFILAVLAVRLSLSFRYIGTLVAAFLFLVLLFLFARSALIPLFVFLLIMVFEQIRGRFTFSKYGLLISAGLLLFVFSVYFIDVLSIMYESAISSTDSFDYRINQYEAALVMIEKSLLIGHGADLNIDDTSVHNLFLRALTQGGVLALFPAIVFFMSLLIEAIKQFMTLSANKHDLRKRAFSLIALGFVLLPISRSLVTASEFNLAEWCCISMFFALVTLNKRTVIRKPD